MTKLQMNGLILNPYHPTSKSRRSKIHEGDIYKGFKILKKYHTKNMDIVYFVECIKCHRQSYNRFKHPTKVKGCRSCLSLEKNFELHKKKIGSRIGTYTVIDVIRKEPHGVLYKVKCDCGYEGTRYKLSRISACVKCKYPTSPYNRIGITIGKLHYLKYLGESKFEARCVCGNKCIVHATQKSCGCSVRLDNHRAKLTKTEVFAMRELYETGSYSYKDLCEMFKIDSSTFYKIIKHEKYKY